MYCSGDLDFHVAGIRRRIGAHRFSDSLPGYVPTLKDSQYILFQPSLWHSIGFQLRFVNTDRTTASVSICTLLPLLKEASGREPDFVAVILT